MLRRIVVAQTIGDFTLQRMTTPAVLDAQMNLVTRLFLHSLQYGILVLGFLDAFCLCPS